MSDLIGFFAVHNGTTDIAAAFTPQSNSCQPLGGVAVCNTV